MVKSAKKEVRFVRGAAALLIAVALNGAIFWALVGLNQPMDLTAPDQPAVRLVTLTTTQAKPPQPIEPPPEVPQPPPQMMTVELDMDDPPPPTPQPLNIDLDLDLAVASVDPIYIPVVRQPAPIKPQPAPIVAAPVAPPITGPLDAERVDQPPRELSNPQPAYPRSALSLGREGAVTVKLLIDERGEVRDADIVQVEGHPAFREAVLEAVRRWRFTPARHRQQAVQVWAVKTIRFELGE